MRDKLKLRSKLLALKEDTEEFTLSDQDSSLGEQRLAHHSSVEISNITANAPANGHKTEGLQVKAKSYPNTSRLEPSLGENQLANKIFLLNRQAPR